MPRIKSKDLPETLRPYAFHGVDLQNTEEKEALADCPFCGRSNKFSISTKTSKFRCLVCDVRGNSASFLPKFHAECLRATLSKDYVSLCEESGFVDPESPERFGVVRNIYTGEWTVPGYNVDRKLTGLYRYCFFPKDKKWNLLPTPGMGHHLFNLHNYEDQKPIVDLCEGWRDAIAWEEVLRLTVNNGVPYLTDRNVLAVAGTNSFKAQWGKFFSGKVVNILFDNDYPVKNKNTGEDMTPAGVKGVKRVASILASLETPPDQINFLAWGGYAKGYSKKLPDGADLRDYLKENL